MIPKTGLSWVIFFETQRTSMRVIISINSYRGLIDQLFHAQSSPSQKNGFYFFFVICNASRLLTHFTQMVIPNSKTIVVFCSPNFKNSFKNICTIKSATQTLHIKWSFPLRIFSVNVTTAANVITFTEQILNGKLHFLCSVALYRFISMFLPKLQERLVLTATKEGIIISITYNVPFTSRMSNFRIWCCPVNSWWSRIGAWCCCKWPITFQEGLPFVCTRATFVQSTNPYHPGCYLLLDFTDTKTFHNNLKEKSDSFRCWECKGELEWKVLSQPTFGGTCPIFNRDFNIQQPLMTWRNNFMSLFHATGLFLYPLKTSENL